MRVLVAGGAGVIGRPLVELLRQTGHQVAVLDRADVTLPTGVELFRGDIRDRDVALRAMAGRDAVIHLATPSSFLVYETDPFDSVQQVLTGFVNLVEAASRHGVVRFVFASTSAVYEGNGVPYEESMTLRPPDLKALAKKQTEELASLYAPKTGMTFVGLRPFSVYGCDERHKGVHANVVSLFTWAICGGQPVLVWGDGEQTRDLVFAEDAARAFALALTCPQEPATFRAVNLGAGSEISFIEIIAAIARASGRDPASVDRHHVPVPVPVYAERLLADTSKQRSLLGFMPEVGIRSGVRRVVEQSRRLPPDELARLAQLQRGALSVVSGFRKGGDER